METIFKSAMRQIHANQKLKKKTEEYLMENLAAMPNDSNRAKKKGFFTKQLVAAACSVALLCTASIGAYAYYNTPTSYLSLDINPSVELGVNPFSKVVSATAYNDDGKTILDGQNVIGSDVKSAVDTLVTSAAQNGFVAEDGSTVIAVTSEADNDTTAAELEDAAAEGANSAIKTEGETATVQKENVALARRDEARKLGITPGKLNLIQKLQKLDPSITVDQYKDAKVTEIMKKYVELKKAASPNSTEVSSSTSSVTGVTSSESKKESAARTKQSAENSKKNQETERNGSSSSSAESSSDAESSSVSQTAEMNKNTEQSSAVTNSRNKEVNGNAGKGQSVANSHKK